MSKIQVVWFRDLTRWDTNSNFQTNIKSIHKEIAFGDFLQIPEVEWEILQPEKEYKILGVRSYGLGVYQNRITQGKNLITKTTKKYQKIKPENLFWCKVDTKNGAFGVTSNEHSNFYASHNMIQAKIDTSIINPLFLQYLFACKFFQKFLDSKVTGTTNRQYISFNELKYIKIPLPPLEIQNNIVADIHAVQAKIKALQDEEKRLKDEIEAYIYIALGLSKPQIAKKQKVFVVRFKDLERWDTAYNQSAYNQTSQNAKLDTYHLQELCDINPSVDMKELIRQDKNVSFIPMERLETDGKSFAPLPKKASLHKGFTKFQNNDLLWAKITPCMQNKKSVVVNGLENGVGFGSTEFFVLRVKDTKQTDICFILQILRTDLVIEQAKLHFKGSAGQQRVPKEFLENLQIPLPPLQIQKEIVAFVESKTTHISNLAQERSTLQNSIEFKLQKMLVD